MTEILVGAYTSEMGGTARGIGRARSHPDGRLEFLGTLVETGSTSWLLAVGDIVHAALEGTDEVASYARADGGLTELSRVSAGGVAPCHLTVSDGVLLAACYEDGAVAVLDLDDRGAVAGMRQVIAGEGSGPMPKQNGPHAHTVHPLADGRVLSLDLGADRLHVHRWVDGRLERIDSLAFPAGTGPRDLVELPGGELGVLGEWSCELLLLEPLGDAFEIVQILALPGGTAGADPAAGLALSASGRHLFAGIRGANRVAIIELEPDGAVAVGSVPSGGDWPRHLVVDGDLLHVANQLSNSIATFRIAADGSLTSVGDPVAAPSPTYLLPLA